LRLQLQIMLSSRSGSGISRQALEVRQSFLRLLGSRVSTSFRVADGLLGLLELLLHPDALLM
jgi:hypothetical protein